MNLLSKMLSGLELCFRNASKEKYVSLGHEKYTTGSGAGLLPNQRKMRNP